jgi:hypothetical protein
MRVFLDMAVRVREFVPEAQFSVYITGDAPPLLSDDPQVLYAHRASLDTIKKHLASGKFDVFHRATTADDYSSAAVWCYPTHVPEIGCVKAATLAQRHGAIPVYNPIGVLATQVFAGIPIYGIPVLDPLVQMRYTYETIRLLTEPGFQESIRVPMMQYANSKVVMIATDATQIDGWMTFDELEWLAARASEMESVAEIGCWLGRSTNAIAKACPGKVWAVDHWKGGKDEPAIVKAAAADDKIYNQFVKNTAHLGNVKALKMASVDAAVLVAPDMAFIDAGHSYDDVVADIRAWRKSTDRLLCGHDYDWDDVRRAVHDELGEVERGPGSIWFKWLRAEAKDAAA